MQLKLSQKLDKQVVVSRVTVGVCTIKTKLLSAADAAVAPSVATETIHIRGNRGDDGETGGMHLKIISPKEHCKNKKEKQQHWNVKR